MQETDRIDQPASMVSEPSGTNEGGTLATVSGHASAPSGSFGTTAGSGNDNDWRAQLALAIRDAASLRQALDLPPASSPEQAAAEAEFPVLVPRAFLSRMRPGDPEDPLLRQVLALGAEMEPQPAGFCADPLAETDCQPVPGLLRKYQGRALLVVTGACAVHCRYCFRRHFAYSDLPRGRDWWAAALAEVAADPDCREVLFSGGDPLILGDRQLGRLLQDFGALPQVRRLRIHTRLPIVLPDRVTEGLCEVLAAAPVPVVVVLHSNHSAEIDTDVRAAATRLAPVSGALLNQTVLLAGINDDAARLADLSEALFSAGILPYYLHLLDPVAGAAHFAVPLERARGIYKQLHSRLSGYLLPRLVQEEPGAAGKSPAWW